jgi:hypothetical protein
MRRVWRPSMRSSSAPNRQKIDNEQTRLGLRKISQSMQSRRVRIGLRVASWRNASVNFAVRDAIRAWAFPGCNREPVSCCSSVRIALDCALMVLPSQQAFMIGRSRKSEESDEKVNALDQLRCCYISPSYNGFGILL